MVRREIKYALAPRWRISRRISWRRDAGGRRGEISTPIITILVTVAALAVTGMAISWMASAGTAASSQGALIILGTPVAHGNTLYLTLKNIGTANSTLISCNLGSQTSQAFSPALVPAGSSSAISVTFGSTFTPGQTLRGLISTDQGTVQFSAFSQ